MKHTELITAIIAISILLITLGGYAWWHQGLLEKRTDSNNILQEIQQAVQKEGQLARLASKTEQLVANESLVSKHLVREEDIVSFLRHVEGVGASNNALIEITSVSDTAKEGHVDISLKATGSFSSIMKTVAMLEHDQYALSAKNINISAQSEGDWELLGTFTALTYVP
jgi:hypothetical protein